MTGKVSKHFVVYRKKKLAKIKSFSNKLLVYSITYIDLGPPALIGALDDKRTPSNSVHRGGYCFIP